MDESAQVFMHIAYEWTDLDSMTINFLIAKYILQMLQLLPGHNEIRIASGKKLVWAGLEQIVVDLQLNSDAK